MRCFLAKRIKMTATQKSLSGKLITFIRFYCYISMRLATFFVLSRRQLRVNVSELGFLKLLPSEILYNNPNSVLETAKSKLPKDQMPHEVSTVKVEELKANCLNQWAQFAKNIVHYSITVGELYDKNLNG